MDSVWIVYAKSITVNTLEIWPKKIKDNI